MTILKHLGAKILPISNPPLPECAAIPRNTCQRSYVDLSCAFEQLRSNGEELCGRNIQSIMVEGGAKIIQSLLQTAESKYTSFEETYPIDNVVITITPTFVGGYHYIRGAGENNGRVCSGTKGMPQRMTEVTYEVLGSDVVIIGTMGDRSSEESLVT
jgi:riboflavin biosynthesis pyrimidine reductase